MSYFIYKELNSVVRAQGADWQCYIEQFVLRNELGEVELDLFLKLVFGKLQKHKIVQVLNGFLRVESL